VTSRQIKERLDKELLGNVALRVENTEQAENSKFQAAVNCSWRFNRNDAP
jgi:predicted membrane GTPase involved in stress response